MPLFEPTVPGRYLAALLGYLETVRTPAVDMALAEAGVDLAGLTQGPAVLSMAEFDELYSTIVRVTGRQELGFETGRRMSVDKHGALGQLLPRCVTLEEALLLASRHYHLITSAFFLDYRRFPDRAELAFRPGAPMSTVTLHGIEETHALGLNHLVADALAGVGGTYDTYLSMEPPPHAERYERFPNVRFHFGLLPLPEVRTVIAADHLKAPLRLKPSPGSEAIDAAAVLSQTGDLLGENGRWADWIELMLREAEDCQPSLEQLAEILKVSSRTLTRRLADEGVTFRDLSKAIRHERACEMLRSQRLPISQIAFRLGYTDLANFTHAFQAMAGMSPRAYRQAEA